NANHVHFNTSWGTNDLSYPRGVFLNRLSLINKHDQQLIAQTYFTAFFKKVFDGDASNDLLMKNPLTYKEWLPETEIVSQYNPSIYEPILQYSRSDEPVGKFDGFVSRDIITPQGRSGNDHSRDVLELA